MKEHDVTEQAFKNGYEKGRQDVASEILKEFSQFRALSPKFCEVYYTFEKKYIGEKNN